jgi:hypothetical protein
MFALTRIDSIVHRDLYNYGLTFSYEWAMPYWTMTIIAFAMGWFNIITACAFQFYVLLYGQRKAEEMPQREALKPETTYQPQIEEEPIEAERVEELKPAETAEVETRETIAPTMEIELEAEEAQKPAEEPKEEPVTAVEAPQEETQALVGEEMPKEYMETTQPEEVEEYTEEAQPETIEVIEERGEEEAKPSEIEETKPEEAQVEEQREQEAELEETVETESTSYVEEGEEMPIETEETPAAPEIKADTGEEETPTWIFAPREEHETTEDIQQQETG